MCDPTTNKYITVQRGGRYAVVARITWTALSAISLHTITSAYINGSSSTVAAQDERYAGTPSSPAISASGPAPFTTGQYCTLSAYQNSGSSQTVLAATSSSPGGNSLLSLTEVPAW